MKEATFAEVGARLVWFALTLWVFHTFILPAIGN